jgi:AsmA-like protein
MTRPRVRAVLFVLLALVLVGVFVARAAISPERVRARVVAALRDAIGAPVDVESVSLSLFRGSLQVTGIQVHAPEPGRGGDDVIARTDAKIDFRTTSLLSGTPDVRRVTLSNSRLRFEHRADGSWNFGSLAEARGRSGDLRIPALTVDDAVLEVRSDLVFAAGTPQILRGIHLSLEPTEDGPYRIEGRVSDPSFGTYTIDGEASRSFDEARLSVVRRGLVLGPDLRARFSRAVQATWDEVQPSGVVDVEGTLAIGAGGVAYRLGVDCKGLGLEFREFPYPVRDIFGRVDLDNHEVAIRDVHAAAGAAVLRIAGAIRGYATDAPEFEITLGAKRLAFDAALKKALEKSYEKFWNAFQPSGTADVDCTLRRLAGSENLEVEARVKLEDANLTYVGLFDPEVGRPLGFPYTVEKIQGDIVAVPGNVSFDIAGKSGRDAAIHIRGSVVGAGKYPEVRVNIDGTDVPLDDKLRAALDPEGRAAWDRFRLAGTTDVKAEVFQAAGPKQPTITDVTAMLKNAAVTFERFPYPLDKVTGTVHIIGNDATVTGLVAHNGPAEFHVDAHVVGPGDDASRDIRVDATNVPLNLTLRNAIAVAKPSLADLWDELAAQGTSDFHYEETRPLGHGQPVHVRGSGHVTHGSARYTAFPLSCSEIEGSVRFDDDHVEILGIEGSPLSGGRVRLDGDVRGEGADQRIAIDVVGGGLALDAALEEAVRHGKMSGLGLVLDELRPSGTFALHYRYVEEPGSPARTFLHVDPQGMRIESKYLPYPATDVRLLADATRADPPRDSDGSSSDPTGLPAWADPKTPGITYVADALSVNALQGRIGMGTFRLRDGSALVTDDGIDRVAVTVDASELPIDDRVWSTFPAAVADELAKLRAEGTLALAGLRVGARLDGGRWHVEVEGNVGFDGFRISPGVSLEKMRGTVAISEADIFGSSFWLDADVVNMDLEVLGRKVGKATAKLMARPSMFLAYRIGGDFYGGQILQRESTVQLRFGDPTRYEGKVAIVEVDAEKLAADLFPGQSDVKGTARASMEFHGFGSSIVDLQASGELRVREGQLLRLPLIDSLLRLLSIRSRPSFRDMDVEFAVRDGVVDFERFDFSSTPMSLEGTGTLDMDGTLDLIFKTTIAPDVKLFVIDWILDWLKGTFFAVRVWGPIENPRSALTNFIIRAAGDPNKVPKEPKEPPFRIRKVPVRF